MSLKFKYAILYVQDVALTLTFFEEAFGLKRAMLHEGGDYGELATGATKLAFASRSLLEQLGKAPASPDVKAPTFEIAFEVDDVDAAFSHAVATGAQAVQPPRVQPWGQTTSYVSDNNGFLIEICSPVGEAADASTSQ